MLVVGAGPAGLAAAWRAALRGASVLVVDGAGAVGGMAASFDVGGIAVDYGSHRLHPSTRPDILRDLAGLLGDDLQLRTRHGRIRLLDRWVAFPLQGSDLVRNLPPRFAARAARDAATGFLQRDGGETFSSVVRARLGPTVAETFYEPYVRKLWGTEPSALTAELARRRISSSGPADILRRVTRRAGSNARSFYYPRRGFGQISEALAGEATEAGANIRLGARVERIAARGDGSPFRAVLADGTEVEAGLLWSTAPAAALAGLVDDAPGGVVAAASALRHRAMVLVYLLLDRAQYTEFDAHYFPAAANASSRVSEPKNYRSSADDPTDRTVLCAEVPCWEGDVVWNAEPDQLGELVAQGLRGDGLPDPTALEVEVRRLPRVYPVYRPGFEVDLAAVERWANDTGVVVFGRQGLFVGDNTHHVLEMAWAVAECLGGDGSFDRAAWRRAREGFRAHVVED